MGTSGRVILIILFSVIPYLALTLTGPLLDELEDTEDIILETGNVSIFFCPRDRCDLVLRNQILSATYSIDCALFDLDDPLLMDAFARRARRINVSIILDERNHRGLELYDFIIPVKRRSIMHHKFCVFDGETVSTGSYNPTIRGGLYNNNNLVIIESKELARIYLDGIGLLLNETTPQLRYGVDSPIKAYFCPRDYCEYRIIEELERANSSILFMTYSFTSGPIKEVLLNLSHKGISIEGIYEAKRKNEGVYSALEGAVGLTPDTNPYSLHHKVFIIDDDTVITGSYNPTKNAAYRNDENVLIISDALVAERFIAEFRYLLSLDALNRAEKTSTIIISDVVYDPPGRDEGKEYVELGNIGEQPIDLRGWKLRSGRSTMFLDFVLGPDEWVRLTSNEGLFRLPNKGLTLILQNLSETVAISSWGVTVPTEALMEDHGEP